MTHQTQGVKIGMGIGMGLFKIFDFFKVKLIPKNEINYTFRISMIQLVC